MSFDWLTLHLEAPLMAFGGEAVDQIGPTRSFPAASMLTGLLANAMGWHWTDRIRHQQLQDRLVFAAAILREGSRLTDSQNARLYANDEGWTTTGEAEGRNKQSSSYGQHADEPDARYLTHRRRRDYLVDAALLVVLRLADAAETPTLDDVERALDRPTRPLFIGRKPCLPSRRIAGSRVAAESGHAALIAAGARSVRAAWPQEEGPKGNQLIDLCDERNWITGLHGGARRVFEGHLP